MFSMSWRSSLLETPFPGARASRPPGPEARNGRPAEGPPLLIRAGRPRLHGSSPAASALVDSRLRGNDGNGRTAWANGPEVPRPTAGAGSLTVTGSQGRRSCHVRPRCSLAGLVFGLTLVALLAGIPKVNAGGEDMPAGGEFTLTSLQGPVNLSDHRGKVVLLFFGYTSCPDVCPLSLFRIGNCLSSLEDEQAEQVSALFITLDPERDTAERMRQYAGFFHPQIVGLTGDAEAIDEVTTRYGIGYERNLAPESALGYSISHPDTILLVDAEGTLVGEVGGGDGGEALRRKVLELLANRG